MYISPKGKGRQPLATIFLMKTERSNHTDHWLYVSKNIFALMYFNIIYSLVGAD